MSEPASGPLLAADAFLRERPGVTRWSLLALVADHDDERLAEYAQAVMSAAPWPD